MTDTVKNTKRHWSLPVAVLGAGLAVTTLVVLLFWASAQDRDNDQRSAMAEEFASAIEFRMATYVQNLGGTRALFQANDVVTAEGFESYIDSLGVLDDLPGIQALSWNRLVLADDVGAYEQQMRDQNPFLPDDFSVRPVTTEELMVVEYIVPREGNEQALGFNIFSEARRAAAIERSRETDIAAATAPINLVQDAEPVPGILVLLPTRTNGEVDGSVVAVFRTRDLLNAATNDSSRTFTVHDVGGVGLPESEPVLLSASTETTVDSAQVEIDVYGRRWLVSLGSDSVVSSSPLGLILGSAAGVALSVALGWLVYSARRATEMADRKAVVLTRELSDTNHELTVVGSRLESGMDSSDVLVWEHNLTQKTQWSSAGPDHPDAGIETAFASRLHAEDRAKIEADPIHEPGELRERVFRLADRHGTYRWILSRSQAVERNGDHVLIGAHIDITDQHERSGVIERLNEDLTARNATLVAAIEGRGLPRG